jgi:hypothetical protein
MRSMQVNYLRKCELLFQLNADFNSFIPSMELKFVRIIIIYSYILYIFSLGTGPLTPHINIFYHKLSTNILESFGRTDKYQCFIFEENEILVEYVPAVVIQTLLQPSWCAKANHIMKSTSFFDNPP